MNDPDAAKPERLVAEAMAQVADDQTRLRELEAQRQAKSRRGLLNALLVVLGLVAVWDAWMIWRPPRVPPVEQQTCGLMRAAAAVAVEVGLFSAEEHRLPTVDEMDYVLDEDLTYDPRPDGFAIANTDGVHVVSYDGSQPVGEWLAASGCASPWPGV